MRVNVFVYDSNGNIFDDASSLQIDWSVDDSQAVLLSHKDTQYEHKEHGPLGTNGGVQGKEERWIFLFFNFYKGWLRNWKSVN